MATPNGHCHKDRSSRFSLSTVSNVYVPNHKKHLLGDDN